MSSLNHDRNTDEWLRHLDGKITALETKLDEDKADYRDLQVLRDRVKELEKKTSWLMVKVGTLAGSVGALSSYINFWLSGN